MNSHRALLLPNLGAEEGDDWRAVGREPATRVAARLWSHLFSRDTRLRLPKSTSAGGPNTKSAWTDESVAEIWPPTLGRVPNEPAYDWIEPMGAALPWLRTKTVGALIDPTEAFELFGPEPSIVAAVHDKAFALEAARELDLLPKSLAPMLTIIDAAECGNADALIARLERSLRQWPDWTQRRFTLKPRMGTSGRGRVAGVDTVDTAAVRGALSRLADRGGALFEPWLDRCLDLSVCLHVASPTAGDPERALPTLLGSLEMIATRNGGYRGHCGEIDSRGRIFSGHREDETLRAQAAQIAGRAAAVGYFGPCGVDAFVYRQGAREGARDDAHDEASAAAPSDSSTRERLRPAVEFNARPTMGLVVMGLLRRALPAIRSDLGLEPGNRRGFLFALVSPDADHGHSPADRADRIAHESNALLPPIALASPKSDPSEAVAQPFLFFAQEREALRAAHRRLLGC